MRSNSCGLAGNLTHVSKDAGRCGAVQGPEKGKIWHTNKGQELAAELVKVMFSAGHQAGCKRVAIAQMLGIKPGTVDKWAKRSQDHPMPMSTFARLMAEPAFPASAKVKVLQRLARLANAVDVGSALATGVLAADGKPACVASEVLDLVHACGSVAAKVRESMSVDGLQAAKIDTQEGQEIVRAIELARNQLMELEASVIKVTGGAM
jgi:hypothetical protein